MNVFDVVTGELASGGCYYHQAIVACLDPFVLISFEGDMRWSTKTQADVEVSNIKPNKFAMLKVAKRFNEDFPELTQLEVPKFTIEDVIDWSMTHMDEVVDCEEMKIYNVKKEKTLIFHGISDLPVIVIRVRKSYATIIFNNNGIPQENFLSINVPYSGRITVSHVVEEIEM